MVEHRQPLSNILRQAIISPVSDLTYREEMFCSFMHLFGLFISIAAFVALVVFGALYGDAWHIVGYSIYGVTLISLYAVSTLFHWIRRKKAKEVFLTLDLSCIYLLIAGTYTPFALIALRGGWGWSLFGVVWGFALTGILLKIIFRKHWKGFTTAMYLSIGWVCIIFMPPLFRSLTMTQLAFVFGGGLAYTVGAIVNLCKRIPYHHALWHLFVLVGSISHYIAILLLIFPRS